MRIFAKQMRLAGLVVAISLAASAALGMQGTAWADSPISIDLGSSVSLPGTDGVSLDPGNISVGGVSIDLGGNDATAAVTGAVTSAVEDPTDGALTLPDTALKFDTGAIDSNTPVGPALANASGCITISGGSCEPSAPGTSPANLPGILLNAGSGVNGMGTIAGDPSGNGSACLTVGPKSCDSSDAGPPIGGLLLPPIVSTTATGADSSLIGGGSAAGNSGTCVVVGVGSCSGSNGTGFLPLPDIISTVGTTGGAGTAAGDGSVTGQLCTIVGFGSCGSDQGSGSQNPPATGGPSDPGAPTGAGNGTGAGSDDGTPTDSTTAGGGAIVAGTPIDGSVQVSVPTTGSVPTGSVSIDSGTNISGANGVSPTRDAMPSFDWDTASAKGLPASGLPVSFVVSSPADAARQLLNAGRDSTAAGSPPRGVVVAASGSVSPPRTGDGGLLRGQPAQQSSALTVLLTILVAGIGLSSVRRQRR